MTNSAGGEEGAGEELAPTRHTARWVAGGALVIAAALIAVLATRPPAATDAQSPLLGKVAPPIRSVTVSGVPYSVPRVPGRFIVLNFFASWCEPCIAEGPDLVAFEFEHQHTGDASVVSVVFEDTVSAASSYQDKLGTTWPTLADTQGKLALNFGVRGPPSTFVIAPDGRVAAYTPGPLSTAALDNIITRAKLTHA